MDQHYRPVVSLPVAEQANKQTYLTNPSPHRSTRQPSTLLTFILRFRYKAGLWNTVQSEKVVRMIIKSQRRQWQIDRKRVGRSLLRPQNFRRSRAPVGGASVLWSGH